MVRHCWAVMLVAHVLSQTCFADDFGTCRGLKLTRRPAGLVPVARPKPPSDEACPAVATDQCCSAVGYFTGRVRPQLDTLCRGAFVSRKRLLLRCALARSARSMVSPKPCANCRKLWLERSS
jgi:hypothetical protein